MLNQFIQTSWKDLQNCCANMPLFMLIDLALLSNKKIALKLSQQQYLESVDLFSFLLNDSRVLLVPHKTIQTQAPAGFISQYDQLLEKASFIMHCKLKGIKLIIFYNQSTLINQKKIIQSIQIKPSIQYDQIINYLKEAAYEQVNQVDSVRQYCIKGGIIDFFSPLYNSPIRLCLYDEEPSLHFYSLSSGLSTEEPLNCIYLNRTSNKTTTSLIEEVCGVYKFKLIDTSIPQSYKPQIQPIPAQNLIKEKSKPVYTKKISLSAYKDNSSIYAPLFYKNKTNKQTNPLIAQPFIKGDLVCHEDFGVGIFNGLYINNNTSDGEGLQIKYVDGNVYVSVNQLFKVSFVSRETNTNIVLNSLSKKNLWKRKRVSLENNAKNYVDKIVNMYVRRDSEVRASFLFGGYVEDSFLEAFEYTDTKDQAIVWKEIKKDLECTMPMCRLLCGDVGFGKTELAMRTAFRVAFNGGQVVVLAPTSILVHQHFKVFKDRFKGFGVNINYLHGSLTLKERNKIICLWVEKKIDILIASTAVLYNDVFVKQASLFIIDEEHRFGVKVKEVLLNQFSHKDILFMSATPIPRTLHLGLSGIHDISTLSSPPQLRLPINTSVTFFSKPLIKRVVEFELARGGQVLYVYNKINTMSAVKRHLSSLLPMAHIKVAHSRLSSSVLKKTMLDFVGGRVDLLLCTSIIGSGLDIPNTNTIIIDKAHLFGVAQLHQIRGRVGRGKRQAYAYLLVPKKQILTIGAKQRLKSIEKNTELGSGYVLAKSDLELRGGGSIFGYKQSGNLFDVGYEYYAKTISRAASSLIKENKINDIDSFVYSVFFPCYFSEEYIAKEGERLKVYRELCLLYDTSKLNLYIKGLIDIYGPLSGVNKNIVFMRQVVLLCVSFGVSRLVCHSTFFQLFFNNSFKKGNSFIKFLHDKKAFFGFLDYTFLAEDQQTSVRVVFNGGSVLGVDFLVKFLMECINVYKK